MESEAGSSLSSRPAFSTEWAPGHPKMHRENLNDNLINLSYTIRTCDHYFISSERRKEIHVFDDVKNKENLQIFSGYVPRQRRIQGDRYALSLQGGK